MKLKNQVSLERLIGKIDNDFNISESDWIPRVAAWTIDALAQMNVLPMEKKRRTLEVSDRIAQFPCKLNARELKVFDENGNEIPELNRDSCCAAKQMSKKNTDKTIAIIDVTNTTGVDFMKVGSVVSSCGGGKNFVLDCDKIELNFDADTIDVETFEVATYHDEYYDCECPYIYDDGALLEALAWYCMFKYLSRGSKHPVFDLKSPNETINPYRQWFYWKTKAAASVKSKLASASGGWANFFYNFTFRPRD